MQNWRKVLGVANRLEGDVDLHKFKLTEPYRAEGNVDVRNKLKANEPVSIPSLRDTSVIGKDEWEEFLKSGEENYKVWKEKKNKF